MSMLLVVLSMVDLSYTDVDTCRRGKSGGQVRDEYRDEYDPGRGGYGRAIAEERKKEEEEYGKGR